MVLAVRVDADGQSLDLRPPRPGEPGAAGPFGAGKALGERKNSDRTRLRKSIASSPPDKRLLSFSYGAGHKSFYAMR